ncbi:hypothetical protein BJX66DRAFT_228494 [Aspergillus keveii]|uniref:Uncharacterized protein n=1 Tax=Aspergillus keveii TaxID=714993 RepID=A0ABR4GL22_9EURO
MGMIILGATVGVLLRSLLTVLGLYVKRCFKKRKPDPELPYKLTQTGFELTGELMHLPETREDGICSFGCPHIRRTALEKPPLLGAEHHDSNSPAPSTTPPSAKCPAAAPPTSSWS